MSEDNEHASLPARPLQPKTLEQLHQGLAGTLKRYEQVVGELPVEVINEYRYAARSTIPMLEMLSKRVDFDAFRASPEFAHYQNLFEQAEHALRCGYHDLIDGLVFEITEYLNEMTAGLSAEAIDAMGDFRNEILDDLEACNALIQRSREHLDERESIYDEIYAKWFEKLLADKKRLKTSVVPKILDVQRRVESERDQLVKMREEEVQVGRRRHEQTMRWTVAGLVVTTVLGIISTVVSIMIAH